MRSDGSNVKRITFGKGIYGTPVWSPRGDLIALQMHKVGFIGVMRTDGSGERLSQKTIIRRHFHGLQTEGCLFFIERQKQEKRRGIFS